MEQDTEMQEPRLAQTDFKKKGSFKGNVKFRKIQEKQLLQAQLDAGSPALPIGPLWGPLSSELALFSGSVHVASEMALRHCRVLSPHPHPSS